MQNVVRISAGEKRFAALALKYVRSINIFFSFDLEPECLLDCRVIVRANQLTQAGFPLWTSLKVEYRSAFFNSAADSATRSDCVTVGGKEYLCRVE